MSLSAVFQAESASQQRPNCYDAAIMSLAVYVNQKTQNGCKRNGTAVEQVQNSVGEHGLYALINNAGIVIPGPLSLTPLEDFRAQFEVNVFGLLDVTQQFLPLLGARKNSPYPLGRVINISSVSGKIAYPFMGAYAATKHALSLERHVLRSRTSSRRRFSTMRKQITRRCLPVWKNSWRNESKPVCRLKRWSMPSVGL
jgi:hypothetical protein